MFLYIFGFLILGLSGRASVAVLDLSALRKKDWKETGKEDSYHSSEEEEPDGSEVELGPGQVQPRASLKGRHAEVKLNLLMTKGQLEVEVICARELKGEPTDTYVKTYLRDGDKWSQKRKTRVVRHSRDPQFGQTLKYAACDILGRTLVVMVWEHSTGFEHNKPLGGAELALDRLTLTQPTHGWYPLFPIHSLPSGQDSP